MKTIAIIPARMASTRFPNKPLAPLLGLPMIEHIRRRVLLCRSLSNVIVATCDKEIADVVVKNGGTAVMTSDKHERCTDRIAEAAENFNADIVVNVQGDEPLVHPSMIEALVKPFNEDNFLQCTNLMSKIGSLEEFQSPNVVKVVVNNNKDLLYASREAIPSLKKSANSDYTKWKQLGLIAFRSDFLGKFSRLTPTPLEIIESIDMMRAVEHGYRVKMVETKGSLVGVDVPEDVNKAETLLKNDPLLKEYL